MVRPLVRGGVGWLDLGSMLLLALALFLMLLSRCTLGRAEGALLLASYVTYLGRSIAGASAAE